jgi:predicted NAD/FAD-binding protein
VRVAVVGTGIAGNTAAWLLTRDHEVTLFEAEDRPGGHTHTHDVTIDGRPVAVDTGFIVYNDRNYPQFLRLLNALGVRGQETEMSFSVANEATGVEYNGGSLGGLFAQRANLTRLDFWGMLLDILRFNRQAPKLMALHGPGPTLGQFLRDAGYGEAFVRDYLVPMGAAIWSVPTERMETFPAKRIVEFFDNHGLLTIDDRPQWYTVRGGSRSYLEALHAELATPPRLGTPVRGVRREGGVTVRTDEGTESFDAIVLACHSDQALAMLEDPSDAERSVLGAISWQDNEVVLHTDASILPRAKAAWASWNYRLPAGGAEDVTVSYWMNHLQHLDVSTPLVVTLNQTDALDESKVLRRLHYAHPVFDAPAVAAQARRDEISGVRDTFYCGAYWRYGFHEDGCLSAVEVARRLGVEW